MNSRSRLWLRRHESRPKYRLHSHESRSKHRLHSDESRPQRRPHGHESRSEHRVFCDVKPTTLTIVSISRPLAFWFFFYPPIPFGQTHLPQKIRSLLYTQPSNDPSYSILSIQSLVVSPAYDQPLLLPHFGSEEEILGTYWLRCSSLFRAFLSFLHGEAYRSGSFGFPVSIYIPSSKSPQIDF